MLVSTIPPPSYSIIAGMLQWCPTPALRPHPTSRRRIDSNAHLHHLTVTETNPITPTAHNIAKNQGCDLLFSAQHLSLFSLPVTRSHRCRRTLAAHDGPCLHVPGGARRRCLHVTKKIIVVIPHVVSATILLKPNLHHTEAPPPSTVSQVLASCVEHPSPSTGSQLARV